MKYNNNMDTNIIILIENEKGNYNYIKDGRELSDYLKDVAIENIDKDDFGLDNKNYIIDLLNIIADINENKYYYADRDFLTEVEFDKIVNDE